jgi:hypothetical protein
MSFAIGVIGAVILVVGAALPDKHVARPWLSPKDWCFFVGGLCMFAYSALHWLAGGSVFFLFLQILINIAGVCMMLDTPDRIDVPVVIVAGIVLAAWSLRLFEGYETLLFVVGLVGIGLGYVLETGSQRREVALAGGSALIALFSHQTGDWIFFWLNAFFALFSAYYVWRIAIHPTPPMTPAHGHRRVHHAKPHRIRQAPAH